MWTRNPRNGGVTDSSFVQVRENTLAGSRLRLAGDLGTNLIPSLRLRATYWFSAHHALWGSWRAFALPGSSDVTQAVRFNGAILAPGQRLRLDDTQWYEGGLYYQYRWTVEHSASREQASVFPTLDGAGHPGDGVYVS